MDITRVLPPKRIPQPFFVVTPKPGIFITITAVVVLLPVSFIIAM